MKKLTLLGMAIAALAAFVVPAAASASPVLTSAAAPGVPVEVGTAIVGTSTNALTTGTPLGTLTCDHVEIFGEVTKNNGSEAAGIGTGGETAECLAQPGNRKLTVTDPTLVSLSTNASGVAKVSMTYTADVGPVECHFTGSGTGTYSTGGDTLNISSIILSATSPLCESEEPGEISFSGSFTLTEPGGTPVLIS